MKAEERRLNESVWPTLSFDKEIGADVKEARGREWLETNGRGGFSSFTIASCLIKI